jgi:hypothetical protein
MLTFCDAFFFAFFKNKYASFLLFFFKQFCAFFDIYYALKSEPYSSRLKRKEWVKCVWPILTLAVTIFTILYW